MYNKYIAPTAVISFILFVIMQKSLVASFYLKPLIAGSLGLAALFVFFYFLINMVWHRVDVMVLFAALSVFLFNLCYDYTIEARDFKNKEDIILTSLVGKGCSMNRGSRGVELSGKDEEGIKHVLYTNWTTFDNLRGKYVKLTYLPTSRRVIKASTHIPQK